MFYSGSMKYVNSSAGGAHARKYKKTPSSGLQQKQSKKSIKSFDALWLIKISITTRTIEIVAKWMTWDREDRSTIGIEAPSRAGVPRLNILFERLVDGILVLTYKREKIARARCGSVAKSRGDSCGWNIRSIDDDFIVCCRVCFCHTAWLYITASPMVRINKHEPHFSFLPLQLTAS